MKSLAVFFILMALLGGCVKEIRYSNGQKFVRKKWGRKYSKSKVKMGNEFVYDTLSGRRVMKIHFKEKYGVKGGDYKYWGRVGGRYRIILYDNRGRKAQKIVTDSSPWLTRNPHYSHRKYYKRK
jgi:hypothetical protein